MAYGLIAGLSMAETLSAAPGLVIDLFCTRRDYDDQQHGIKRENLTKWSD